MLKSIGPELTKIVIDRKATLLRNLTIEKNLSKASGTPA